MSDQSRVLREYISSAVEREVTQQVTNVIAPLRDQIQISRGQITQLNKDFGGAIARIDEVTNIIAGNPKLRLRGLQVEVQEMNDKLSALLKERDTLLSEIKGARKALYIIGFLATMPILQQLGILGVIFRALGVTP